MYQQLALQIMNEMYSNHPKHSVLDLLQQIPEWGQASAFSLIFTSKTTDDLLVDNCYYNALLWQWNGDLLKRSESKEV